MQQEDVHKDHAKVLQYLDQFSGTFNHMMQEVMQRILRDMDAGSPVSASDKTAQGPTEGKAVPPIRIDPQLFMQKQAAFAYKQQMLWQNLTRAMLGDTMEPVMQEPADDQRFRDKDWSGNPMFNYLKQAYLLNSEYLRELVNSFEFDCPRTAEQVRFYTRQFINSMSPSNYVLTNPEVCREILETEGNNLARGIDNFMRDLEQSPATAFKVTQVALDAFTLGKDLATTPGKVIFRNELIELIQYTPTTEKVFQVPLLIVPPFINKYYILDLNEKKSMVKWLVAQGYTVFMISWVNPDESLRHIRLEDYMHKGVIAALDAAQTCCNVKKVNVAGYCVGGTLLALTQAYLEAKQDDRIQSLTFLTTLLDFSEPGEVGNYISEQSVPLIEQSIKKNGYFDGRVLALSFSLLRENNLFWSFFIENYLKGKDPVPFDILYWNGDSTNIPGPTYLYYLRNMYIENRLVQPGGVLFDGVQVDLGSIRPPAYCLAAMGDHIVLWNGAYKSAQTLGSDVRFVLTESGHVAGVVNPADKGKYPHWVSETLPDTPQEWLAQAQQQQGSWWNDWHGWLVPKSGPLRKARTPGSKAYPVLGDAPGEYVKVRLDMPVPESVTSAV